jgi:hypothetical protein
MADDGDQALDMHIEIGVDAVGDPFVIFQIALPPGGALTAEMTDQLALKLLAASAASRARASVVRKQLLAGIPAGEAVAFVNDIMET